MVSVSQRQLNLMTLLKMRQLFLSWEGGGFRVTARKHFLMVSTSMLGVTLNAIFLPTFLHKKLEKSWNQALFEI